MNDRRFIQKYRTRLTGQPFFVLRGMDIKQFFEYDLWRMSSIGFGRGKRLGLRVLKTLVLMVHEFTSNRLNLIANGLTYSLLFAMVPILAMILAIARGFGYEDLIEDQLMQSFLGNTDLVPYLMTMVQRYLDTAQGGVFVGVGILLLLWSVYAFFNNVEKTFNEIWNVGKNRPAMRQFITYIAIVVLIPVLIIVTTGLSMLVDYTTHSLIPIEGWEDIRSGLIRLIQFAVSWGVFTWMYIAIPNTKVRFVPALIPGIIMGSLFQLLQMLSVYLILFLGRTSIVYGAFASIPILLTWLQLTCMLILIGAEMSYAIQNNEEYDIDIHRMGRKFDGFYFRSMPDRKKKTKM